MTRRNDAGAAMIIVLVLFLVISVTIVAVSNFAVGAAANSYNLQSERLWVANAESAVSAAIGNLRTQYSPTGTSGSGIHMFDTPPTAQPCLPTTLSTYPSSTGYSAGPAIYVNCIGVYTAGSTQTRAVTFYACATSACSSTLSSLALTAVVDYDDIDPAFASPSGPCSTTCGYSMSIVSWDLHSADS